MWNQGISDWTRVVRTQGGLDFCSPPSGPRHSTVLSDRGLCHESTSGVGAAQADGEGSGAALLREGLLEPGFWKGRGSSLLPPVLCSVARFSLPSPLLCKACTPKTLPPGPFHGIEASFPTSSSEADPWDTTAWGQFPVCGTAGKTGLAGLTQSWPADVTASPPHATPPE